MKLRTFIRKWLGIDRITRDMEYSNQKLNKAMDQSKLNNSLIKSNQKQITRISNTIKKH